MGRKQGASIDIPSIVCMVLAPVEISENTLFSIVWINFTELSLNRQVMHSALPVSTQISKRDFRFSRYNRRALPNIKSDSHAL